MDQACSCEPFRIDTVKSHMTIHFMRDIKTLEIPGAIEHGPVALQDEIERALVRPPEAVAVLTGECERPFSDFELSPSPEIDQKHSGIGSKERPRAIQGSG